ncbi:MAG: radical SAM protein [Promethearchaeota archaeon]
MFNYEYKEFKSAINVLKYPDSWFWCRYTINPYQGCYHSCIYCDARSERYYLEHFEKTIVIKTNLDKLLENKFKKSKKFFRDVIGPGGVCDAYQPIEKEAQNTLKILKIIAKYKFPINIATKSNLILRDIELLNKIAKDTWCTIGFSITTMDDDLANFLEPFSSTPSERIVALKQIKEKAPEIQAGVYFIPIIPYLEDNNDNLENVLKETKKAGGDFILFSPGLTLRDLQKKFFINKLKNSPYSYIIKPLLKLYKNRTYPPFEYTNALNKKLYYLCQKYNLPVREKRWIPKDYRKWNYKISEYLLNKEYINSILTGKSDSTMKWAGLELNNLNESIISIYKRGEMAKLRNFPKRIVKLIAPIIENCEEFKQKTSIIDFL